VIRAVQISSRFPTVHGAPVHINDLSRPDQGDAVDVYSDEIPMFWAYGVTRVDVTVINHGKIRTPRLAFVFVLLRGVSTCILDAVVTSFLRRFCLTTPDREIRSAIDGQIRRISASF
jgi:Protein of unknown function (DUF1445)